MQLKITHTCTVAGTGTFSVGETREVPDDIAEGLIEIGNAEPVNDDPVAPADE